LFKQIVQLYGKGFKEEARKPYAAIVRANVLVAMKTLLEQAYTLGFELEGDASNAADAFGELKVMDHVDAESAALIDTLWTDERIQQVFARRNEYQLTESCEYFFRKLDEIAADDYIPSYQDVLHSRARTTGIVETAFEIEGERRAGAGSLQHHANLFRSSQQKSRFFF
jgi:hypothetical protein